MLARIGAIWTAVVTVLRGYPAAVSGLTGIAVALLARLGLHVTADQLLAIIVPVTAVLAAAVHASVTPTAKRDLAASIQPGPAGPAGGG